MAVQHVLIPLADLMRRAGLLARRWRALAAFAKDSRGAAAVEFALMAPLLVSFIAPIADIGMRVYAQMQVEIAAQAGARYAVLHGWNSTNIQSAIVNATGFTTITATPSPTTSCGCASGTTIAVATCGTTCASGETVGTYVTVGAQAPFVPLFPLPTIGVAGTLSSQATVRIK